MPAPVLWIGGPPGSGKTTVARLIARRYGLRLYSSDTHTWRHRDRAIALGHRAAIEWEAMSPQQRWIAPAQELLAMSLHHERGALILQDVHAMPASPLILAEGTPITPTVTGTGAGPVAVWLMPTPEVQQTRLAVATQDVVDGVSA